MYWQLIDLKHWRIKPFCALHTFAHLKSICKNTKCHKQIWGKSVETFYKFEKIQKLNHMTIMNITISDLIVHWSYADICCNLVCCYLLWMPLRIGSISFMIIQELQHNLHHIFLCLAGGYWYSMENGAYPFPTVLAVVHLKKF